MKSLNFLISRSVVIGVSSLGLLLPAWAADENTPETAQPQATQTAPATPKLPYGVQDVLKLSRAQLNEDVVLNYIQNSGTIYNLSPDDIVYLRKEGVSDRTINAMLDQKKRVTDADAAAPTQPPAAPPSTPPPVPPAQPPADYSGSQPAPVYTQPPPPPPSTVYVIPYSPTYPAYGYYYPYPYYRSYWGPSVSFGFGFGGGHFHHRHHW